MDGFTPVEQTLVDKGFHLYREHFRWGKTPAFQNDAGEIRFVMMGKVYPPSEMLEYLRANWIPYAQDDVLYMLDAMGDDFARIGA